MKKAITAVKGFLCGVLNGLFGSGGGVVAVPSLTSQGIEQKKAQATSVAFIFVLSALTTVIYAFSGRLDVSGAMSYIPGGIIGALVGGALLKKIPNKLLKRIFGIIIIISAVRIFLK